MVHHNKDASPFRPVVSLIILCPVFYSLCVSNIFVFKEKNSFLYIHRARQSEIQQHLAFSPLMNPALKLPTNTIRDGRMSITKSPQVRKKLFAQFLVTNFTLLPYFREQFPRKLFFLESGNCGNFHIVSTLHAVSDYKKRSYKKQR